MSAGNWLSPMYELCMASFKTAAAENTMEGSMPMTKTFQIISHLRRVKLWVVSASYLELNRKVITVFKGGCPQADKRNLFEDTRKHKSFK